MRLSTQTQRVIRDTVREIFGSAVTVALFGSRVDDSAQGGDIDLLIQSKTVVYERERKTLKLVARLQIRLGDQPIDVLVVDPNTKHKPVHDEALRVGVRL
ncbi:MAG: nucleotidyltransferase domain-containing protein [Sedimenticola sp.]